MGIEKYCHPQLCTWMLAASVLLMVGWVLAYENSIFGTPRWEWKRMIQDQDEDLMNGMGLELLTRTDMDRYKHCAIKKKNSTGKSLINGTCRFMDGSERAPVALVSFQGSGNTWMRGLLEQATGICTGSTYCDYALRLSGFNGESVDSGVVLVVKTHNFNRLPKWTTQNKPISVHENGSAKQNYYFQNYCYSSAIVIIRNPFHALVADWHRESYLKVQTNGREHTGKTGPKNFGNNSHWSTFVKAQIPNWKHFFDNWLTPANKGNYPILIVKYEDLKKDRVGVMKKVLVFLNMSNQYTNIEQKLEGDYSSFKRKHKSSIELDHFTSSQRSLVNSVILATIHDLLRTNDGNIFGIQEYLG